ncbi:MAG TPA: GntR family transcriptional regulator [Lacisediminihabitans sp.]|uniref:GntR family transcriptional regulator n=1 Tax=Lacisediminihabitans sp. TaxID=2787631 RepID=UPI002ED942E1
MTGTPESVNADRQDRLQAALLDLVDTLPDGAALPAERVLAERLGVARMTLRRAIDQLVDSGEVTKLAGRGTFITKGQFINPSGEESFHEELARHGMRAGSRTVSFAVQDAGARNAERLMISPGSKIVRAVRVRLANDEPVALERIHVPVDLVPGLSADDLDSGSFYDLLREHYGIQIGRSARIVRATVINEVEAEQLGVPVHSPAFYIQSTRYSSDGRIVEFLDAIYRGDRYRFASDENAPSSQPSLIAGRTPRAQGPHER